MLSTFRALLVLFTLRAASMVQLYWIAVTGSTTSAALFPAIRTAALFISILTAALFTAILTAGFVFHDDDYEARDEGIV